MSIVSKEIEKWKASSPDEIIGLYEDEVRDFYDTWPEYAKTYLYIVIGLRLIRIKEKHCNES